MKCPACNNKKHTPTRVMGVQTCKSCGAVHGQCYLGDSYQFVKPFMTDADIAPENLFHYDLTCLGSAGITRRHGWADRATKLIVQVG